MCIVVLLYNVLFKMAKSFIHELPLVYDLIL